MRGVVEPGEAVLGGELLALHLRQGEVVDGKDTLGALEARGSEGGKTTERLVMKKTSIEVE